LSGGRLQGRGGIRGGCCKGESSARERWSQKHREKQNEWLDDWGKRLDAKRARFTEKERVSKELHEAERVQKRERDAQAKAAEEHDDKTGKWQKIDSR
jgi:hypothetical protein